MTTTDQSAGTEHEFSSTTAEDSTLRARAVLAAYRVEVGATVHDDDQTILGDLLLDLRHLAAESDGAVDFDDAAEVSGRYFADDTADAGDEPTPDPGDEPGSVPATDGPGRVYDHEARPGDDPEPGDRCKDCRGDITWEGPGGFGSPEWLHVGDARNQ